MEKPIQNYKVVFEVTSRETEEHFTDKITFEISNNRKNLFYLCIRRRLEARQ